MNSVTISISKNSSSLTRGTPADSTREPRFFTIMPEAHRGNAWYGRQCLAGAGGLIGRGQGGALRASYREKGTTARNSFWARRITMILGKAIRLLPDRQGHHEST